MASVLTYSFAHAPVISEIIHNHQSALRYLKEFIEFYVDIFHYDSHMPIDKPEIFRSFLETCKVLLYYHKYDNHELTKEEQTYLLIFEYWAKRGNISLEEVPNYICQKPMKLLMPVFFKALSNLNKNVLAGKYYWRNKNINYLRLVYENQLLEHTSEHEQILKLGYEIDQYESNKPKDYQMFLFQMDN